MTRTVARANAVEIQVISSTVAPTAPRMCGMATFTIDASMAPMRVPNVTETVTSHLLTLGRAGAGAEIHTEGEVVAVAISAPCSAEEDVDEAGDVFGLAGLVLTEVPYGDALEHPAEEPRIEL